MSPVEKDLAPNPPAAEPTPPNPARGLSSLSSKSVELERTSEVAALAFCPATCFHPVPTPCDRPSAFAMPAWPGAGGCEPSRDAVSVLFVHPRGNVHWDAP